jgi:hypothetical protein
MNENSSPIPINFRQTRLNALALAEKAHEAARIAERRAKKLKDWLRMDCAVSAYNDQFLSEASEAKKETL